MGIYLIVIFRETAYNLPFAVISQVHLTKTNAK